MIKANELRIGNYLMGLRPVRITKIFSEDAVGIGSGDPYYVYAELPLKPCLKPIRLTPELLAKCVFEKKDEFDEHWSYEGFILWNSENGFYHINSELLIYVNHLHQLQNLIFALTGEELPINL